MKILFTSISLLLLLFSCQTQDDSQPNIIYILADDLGYGDLSCLGQTSFQTPNIDRLASEGMTFTDHYAGCTVCAPSRSVLLTGLHSGHSPIRDNKEIMPEGQHPMEAEAVTIAEVLQEAGYTTGAFGKWGLGFVGSEGDPNNQGFDVFFGYNCQRYAHRYYPEYVWNNSEKFYLDGNDWTRTTTFAPDVIHEKALEFIEENQDKPFFLFYPSNIPHAELIVPDDEILAQFKGKFDERPYSGSGGNLKAAYGPDISISSYCPQDYPKAVFAAMVTRLDNQVGEVIEKVKSLGLEDNTIILFTSDNGPHGEGGIHPDDFNSNGIFRGMKRDLFEGGIRVPFIVSWPGQIEAGSSSQLVSAFWDMMPSFAQLAGVEAPAGIDGLSIVPTLLNQDKQEIHYNLYWEFHSGGGRQALRQGKWKAVKYNCYDPSKTKLMLFDLEADPSEENDLASVNPEKAKELEEIMNSEHSYDPLFPFGK